MKNKNVTDWAGNSFRTPYIFCVLMLLPVVAIVGLWWHGHGSPGLYFEENAPAGQILYVFSKLAGLIAIAVLGAQICLGLMRRYRVLPDMGKFAIRWHASVGVLTICLAILHVGLFFFAASERSASPAWSLFFPNPFSGHYEMGLSFGLTGLLILLVVLTSGRYLSGRHRITRLVHQFSLPCYVLLLIHAWSVGSENRLILAAVSFGFILSLVFVLVVLRVLVPWRVARSAVDSP